MNKKNHVDICFSPVLYPFYGRDEERCVVVVDVFRATTCMCAAFHSGVSGIVPVDNIDEAKRMKAQGHIVAAERNVEKCSFADLGNSPFGYMQEGFRGRKIVMTTTNGTQALRRARGARLLLAGAFVNLSRVANFCTGCGLDVLVFCAGWNNKINAEDTLFAGALAERLLQSGRFVPASDAVDMALTFWKTARTDIKSFLQGSEHLLRLLAHGLGDDIDYCLSLDAAPSLPAYDPLTNTMTPMQM